ncbi:hypothetical protein B0T21DRAFT_285864 [Apiosordaria backusii]|uniref:Uncharacterized protein n=1 Tax=Apiosordaria backusii TaxID=314023 RepID=A0AA40BRL1_9PEZI|nr:hypothetical protein B0T21DRAFT_285864 [Apiosordaria backusii]
MDPNVTCTSNRPEVPFIPFLAGLTAWAVAKYILEGIVKRVNPKFDKYLREDVRRRYNFYFSTWLGTFTKVISVVSCTAALVSTPAETDLYGLVRPLNTAEQWCWGCRAVLYIQELPDLSSVPELVIHHILSIAAMCGILAYSAPRRPLYLMWASLWNEFLANARRLMKLHDIMTSRSAWWLAAINCFLVWALRITAAVVSLIWTLQSNTYGVTLFVTIGSILVYILYMVQFTTWELGRFRVINLDMNRPARFIIADKWSIHLLGVVMGIGLALTELSALYIYEASSGFTSSEHELHSIAWVALQAAVAGLLGSYITYPIFRFAIPPAATPHDDADSSPKALRLSLVGGIVSAGLGVLFTPTIKPTIDRTAFLSCMVLSLPLMIAITRFGQAISVPAIRQTPNLTEKLIDIDQGLAAATPEPMLSPDMINAVLHGVVYFSTIVAFYIYQHLALSEVPEKASVILMLLAAIQLNGPSSARHRRFVYRLLPTLQAGLAMAHITYLNLTTQDKDHSLTELLTYSLGFGVILFGLPQVVKFLSMPNPFRRTQKQVGGEGEKKKRYDLKVISVSVGVVLVLLLVLGEYMGWCSMTGAPVVMAVREVENEKIMGEMVQEVVSKGEGAGLWDVVISWPMVASVVGATVLPVVMVQVVA